MGTGILKILIIDSRKFYLKLFLISFNHVNNVMDVYTQPRKKQFLMLLNHRHSTFN